jgi:hypothetical protein
MATSLENMALAENSEFRTRVASIMRKVATYVLGELPSEEVVNNELVIFSRGMVAKRASFSRSILNDVNRSIEGQVAKAICSTGRLADLEAANNLQDSNIEDEITNMYNDLSGIEDADMGTSFYIIQTMGLHSRAANLSLEMLRDAGAVDLVKSNDGDYRTAVNGAGWIADVAALQMLIDDVNAA